MNTQLDLHGPNAGYALELFEHYQRDPSSVAPATRARFDAGFVPDSSPAVVAGEALTADLVEKIVRAARVGRMVREMGHADAKLDPLGSPPPGDEELALEHHGLTEDDLAALPPNVIGGPCAVGAENALEALRRLRAVYSGSVGYEDDHIQIAEERKWFREAAESQRFFHAITDDDRRNLLERLTEVDGFEQFLDKVAPYQGQKRFSIEGIDMLVPVLEALLLESAHAGVREAVIGMAHRGRLNVLAHVLGKPYEEILAEFPTNPKAADDLSDVGHTHEYQGDVKYHKGYHRTVDTMAVTLAPNPSHLEFVNPVVVGRARAAQETRTQIGSPKRDILASLAIQVHGDAAFPGQGVVAETLNMGQLKGYRVGGTIHVIANNQIGFTTTPGEGRSTMYASDLAKGFEIPIVHVNADDPEACLAVARMAIEYRQKFGKDFLIDLVGYRRLGHNESDEPAFTQPKMYAAIRKRPRLRELWATTLEQRKRISAGEADALVQKVREKLQSAKAIALVKGYPKHAHHEHTEATLSTPVTAVPTERLTALNAHLNAVPEGFHIDTKVEKGVLAPRRAALDGERKVLWAHAELLAFGTLLEDGIPVRLSGQDSQRGTFTQRQMVWHDIENGKRYNSLKTLPTGKASLAAHNSPLSETAVLGFEYGYSVHAAGTMVLWEAQFGDFSNGAQVIIDQFIASGKVKWDQNPSVVMLLPHGYEGQGPEHSSGRIERYLQLCAAGNLIVANCSTAAQYFHLLRRQGQTLATEPKPLIVFTPKSLLRNGRAAATLTELAEGRFEPVLDDVRPKERKVKVTRLVLCSGKVYHDLVYGPAPEYAERFEYAQEDGVAIARVEELYPFPSVELADLIATYPNLREVVWLQEEPKNMGAWTFVQPKLLELLGDTKLRYIGRPEEASPAEGSITTHNAEQSRIISEAFQSVPHLDAPASVKTTARKRA